MDSKQVYFLFIPIKMKCKEIELCSFTCWYQLFEDLTYSSIVIPLPKTVLAYLEDGGTVVLPADCQEDDSIDSYDDEPYLTPPDLGNFSEILQQAIQKLGGEVLPKLNWSSPKDAIWMSCNRTLKCSTPTDIYLLMKSSQFVSHDLVSPFENCDDVSTYKPTTDYSIILRKWKEINPSDEFRCYVKDSKLIAISQREATQYYSSIADQKEDIICDITAFYENYIKNTFTLTSYTFDIHRPQKDKINIIDFGPFGVTTDSILFSWDELINDTNIETTPSKPQFRYVDLNMGIQPTAYVQYNFPIDDNLFFNGDLRKIVHEQLLERMQDNHLTGRSSSDSG